MEWNDEAAVAKARAGDPDAFRVLVERHSRPLFCLAFRMTGNEQDAEDVVQETLLRAWRHPESLLNGKGSVRGWLLTVARNIVTDRARARAASSPTRTEPLTEVSASVEFGE
jgi:RNA polymerase sigma-70 factor (ECF subfamily)